MAGPRQSPLNRMIGAVVPRAMDALDPDELLERLDLDAVLARIDLDQLLDRLDLDAVLARIDVDALMHRVDVDALVSRVDVNGIVAGVDIDALVERVDVDALMQRVDVGALLERVDVNALVSEVDVPALVARAGIDQIVSDATSGIATRALDLARRQLLGFDIVMLGLIDRLLRRPRPTDGATDDHAGGTGRRWAAGPLSRVLGFAIDSVTVSASFGLGVSLGGFLLGLFTNRSFDDGTGGGALWLGAYGAWWLTYLWLTVAVSGRTLGKGLVGLRVVALDGTTLRPGAAARRTLVFPISLVLGLGFVPALFGRERRALHDHAAGSLQIVDWGSRPVTPPARLAAWASAPAAPSR